MVRLPSTEELNAEDLADHSPGVVQVAQLHVADGQQLVPRTPGGRGPLVLEQSEQRAQRRALHQVRGWHGRRRPLLAGRGRHTLDAVWPQALPRDVLALVVRLQGGSDTFFDVRFHYTTTAANSRQPETVQILIYFLEIHRSDRPSWSSIYSYFIIIVQASSSKYIYTTNVSLTKHITQQIVSTLRNNTSESVVSVGTATRSVR